MMLKGCGHTMDFAANLNRLMDQAHMTQAELARATKMSSAQIAYLCSGRTKDPKLSTVVKISYALRCTIEDLADPADSLTPPDQAVIRTLIEDEKILNAEHGPTATTRRRLSRKRWRKA